MAAVLRRPVIFMAGLYLGGNRYAVHFEPLADFSERRARTRAAIDAAVGATPQLLERHCREAPYNWFNFYDFWTLGRRRRNAMLNASPKGRPAQVRRWLATLLLLAVTGFARSSRGGEVDVAELMQALAARGPDARDSSSANTSRSWTSRSSPSGEAALCPPDRLEKRTLAPKPECWCSSAAR
jgi:hypothetical protein